MDGDPVRIRGLEPAQFLATCWQRRPLYLPGAWPGFGPPLDPDGLAALACEEGVESRLVTCDGPQACTLRHGPFTEGFLAALPPRGWTLLVQDVDKHLPELAAVLDPFRLVPDWRLDDLMVSHASDGGSVGPHVDQYDVFLLQGRGRKRWRIGVPGSGRPLPHPELDLLAGFEVTGEWVLEPGDCLYLPPGVPHHGIAEGEAMTWSVGFRAPSPAEILAGMLEHGAEDLAAASRYRDPGRSPVRDPTALDPADLDALADFALGALAGGDRHEWLGRWLSEPKPGLEPPPGEELAPGELAARWQQAGTLWRHGGARFLHRRDEDGGARLYAGGHGFRLPPAEAGLAPALCRTRRLPWAQWSPWLERAAAARVLCRLYAEGLIHE